MKYLTITDMGDFRHAAYSVRNLSGLFLDAQYEETWFDILRRLPTYILQTGTIWTHKHTHAQYAFDVLSNGAKTKEFSMLLCGLSVTTEHIHTKAQVNDYILSVLLPILEEVKNPDLKTVLKSAYDVHRYETKDRARSRAIGSIRKYVYENLEVGDGLSSHLSNALLCDVLTTRAWSAQQAYAHWQIGTFDTISTRKSKAIRIAAEESFGDQYTARILELWKS